MDLHFGYVVNVYNFRQLVIFCFYSLKSCMVIWQLLNKYTMGLLTMLKKMKQKEKEVRLLMLYPLIKYMAVVNIWFILYKKSDYDTDSPAYEACMILPVFIMFID